MKTSTLSRRTLLRGMGTAMALPLLDVMKPAAFGAAKSGAPMRMAFMFVPNGVHLERWTPKTFGARFDLPYVLEPLAPVKNDLMVLTGLTHDKGRSNDDGPGDHARSAGVFLTGSQPLKSEGSQIRVGVSVDQVAARFLGADTRFASLEIGSERSRQGGKCDSGYSCAYSNNISWRDADTPLTKEINPRAVFERLFGDSSSGMSKEQIKRRARRQSILDFVMEDARSLDSKVSGSDRQKLDEYLTAVREIEQRIEQAEQQNDRKPIRMLGELPDGIPNSYEEHLRLMGDMMVLAFQTDTTRVASFMLANAGSNLSYRPIGVSDGHHALSHHQGDPEKLDKISRINRFHVQQFSYVLQRLKAIPEGNGTLLDNCMIVYGSGISDGNKHNNENLPVLVAGGGQGSLLTGRHVRVPQETPMCNLFLSLLQRAGVPASSFGDSTGTLRGLEG